MDTEGMIEITGADLKSIVKTAYRLSRPQGLGHIHFQPGDLTDEEASQLIREEHKATPVSLDYVKGRACKLIVFRDGEKLFIRDRWYDHSQHDLQMLLEAIGIKHSVAA
jgi:hypothetical protein